MSNLAAAAQLRQPVSQFPSHWYNDPRVFDAEMRTLFPRAPGYVGHELMVPEAGERGGELGGRCELGGAR